MAGKNKSLAKIAIYRYDSDTNDWFPFTGLVGLGTNEEHIGEVGGRINKVQVEFTRPANTTGYTANDVVSNSASATTLMEFTNAVRVSGGSAYIVRAVLTTDKKSVTPAFRVHLFNASNPTVAADNAAHKELYADASKRLGFFDFDSMATAVDATNSDMSRTQNNTLRHGIVAAAGDSSIYVMLETLTAFTPASGEKFTLTLYFDQN